MQATLGQLQAVQTYRASSGSASVRWKLLRESSAAVMQEHNVAAAALKSKTKGGARRARASSSRARGGGSSNSKRCGKGSRKGGGNGGSGRSGGRSGGASNSGSKRKRGDDFVTDEQKRSVLRAFFVLDEEVNFAGDILASQIDKNIPFEEAHSKVPCVSVHAEARTLKTLFTKSFKVCAVLYMLHLYSGPHIHLEIHYLL